MKNKLLAKVTILSSPKPSKSKKDLSLSFFNLNDVLISANAKLAKKNRQ